MQKERIAKNQEGNVPTIWLKSPPVIHETLLPKSYNRYRIPRHGRGRGGSAKAGGMSPGKKETPCSACPPGTFPIYDVSDTTLLVYTSFFCFFRTLLLVSASGQKPWSQVSSLSPPPPPFLPSIFFVAYRVQQIPLLVDVSSSVANSRSRAFRKSICAQE